MSAADSTLGCASANGEEDALAAEALVAETGEGAAEEAAEAVADSAAEAFRCRR